MLKRLISRFKPMKNLIRNKIIKLISPQPIVDIMNMLEDRPGEPIVIYPGGRFKLRVSLNRAPAGVAFNSIQERDAFLSGLQTGVRNLGGKVNTWGTDELIADAVIVTKETSDLAFMAPANQKSC